MSVEIEWFPAGAKCPECGRVMWLTVTPPTNLLRCGCPESEGRMYLLPTVELDVYVEHYMDPGHLDRFVVHEDPPGAMNCATEDTDEQKAQIQEHVCLIHGREHCLECP